MEKKNDKELNKLLENNFCLGCSRACDLLHPTCERGLVKMQEMIEAYQKDKKVKS